MAHAYYNEHDAFAARWLRELIKAGHIAPGHVDERSIEDVLPAELMGYTQHHFFAGIGVWSLALRRAGWPDDRPVWTGSCPCQPFSAAGKGEGFADERHLWPAFYHLIEQCRPATVFGEQVASGHAGAWIDLVHADVEALGYAFGCVAFPAAGVGAPHLRDRAYWVADADGLRLTRECGGGEDRASERSDAGRVAHAARIGECADKSGRDSYNRQQLAGAGARRDGLYDGPIGEEQPGPTNSLWGAADWLFCRDGRWRAVMPDSFPLADAGAFRNRVGLLRGAGNALTLGHAQGFIESYLNHLKCSKNHSGPASSRSSVAR